MRPAQSTKITLILVAAAAAVSTSARAQQITVIPRTATSPHLMADSVAVYRAVGVYLRSAFGNDFLLDTTVTCASVRQCARERRIGTFAVGDARRGALRSALAENIASGRLSTLAAAIPCGKAGEACRVRGASRFVQLKEPVFKGDSATVVMRVFANGAGVRGRSVALPSTTRIILAHQGGANWAVVGHRARGAAR